VPVEPNELLSPVQLRVNREYLPALLNVNHIFFAHMGSSIIVLVRSFCKAKETVELCANIAGCPYGIREWKDPLRQLMYDFQFSVLFPPFRLEVPY
jgi:hypothetical protein